LVICHVYICNWLSVIYRCNWLSVTYIDVNGYLSHTYRCNWLSVLHTYLLIWHLSLTSNSCYTFYHVHVSLSRSTDHVSNDVMPNRHIKPTSHIQFSCQMHSHSSNVNKHTYHCSIDKAKCNTHLKQKYVTHYYWDLRDLADSLTITSKWHPGLAYNPNSWDSIRFPLPRSKRPLLVGPMCLCQLVIIMSSPCIGNALHRNGPCFRKRRGVLACHFSSAFEGNA
jgi:hypothetical protein